MNNPTIDGVSLLVPLHLLERVSVLGLSVTADQSAAIVELRSLLYAPAVERQEPEVDDEKWWADTPDGDSALVTRVGALTEWQKGRDAMRDERDAALNEFATLQSTIAQLEDKLNKAIDLDFQRRETIERLQARIAELESGRGEPVAWSYCPECGCEELHHEAGEHKQCANCYQEWFSDIDYSDVVRGNLQKLKSAPPAQVSVVYQERLEFERWIVKEWPLAPVRYVRDALPEDDPLHGTYCDEYLQRAWVGWQARACLDATAALNGERK